MSVNKQKEERPSELAHRRWINVQIRQGYVSLGIRFCALAIVLWVLFTKIFLLMQCSGMEMFPALKDGDLVFAYRLQEDYLKNDVVVYNINGKRKIGRIVAGEHDMVSMDEAGKLYVNGTVQDGEILYPTYEKEGLEYPYEVPDGCIFVLGDYRTKSEDSRDWGAVSMETVEGKVITILHRRGL